MFIIFKSNKLINTKNIRYGWEKDIRVQNHNDNLLEEPNNEMVYEFLLNFNNSGKITIK